MAITDYTIDYKDNGSPSAYSNTGETSDIVTTASGFQDAQLSFSLGNPDYKTDVPGFYTSDSSGTYDWTARLKNFSGNKDNPITALDWLTGSSSAKIYEDYYNKTTAEFEDAYKQTNDYYNAYIQALSNSVGAIAAPQIAAERADYNQSSYDLLNRAYATGMVGLGNAQQELKNIFNSSMEDIMASAQSQVNSAVSSAYTQRDKSLSSVQKQYDEFADALSKEWKGVVDAGVSNVKEFTTNIATLLKYAMGGDWTSNEEYYKNGVLTNKFWGRLYDFVSGAQVTDDGTGDYTHQDLKDARDLMLQQDNEAYDFFFGTDNSNSSINRAILLDAMGVDEWGAKNTGIDWDVYKKGFEDVLAGTADNESFKGLNVGASDFKSLDTSAAFTLDQIVINDNGDVVSDFYDINNHKLRESVTSADADKFLEFKKYVEEHKLQLGETRYNEIMDAITGREDGEKTKLASSRAKGGGAVANASSFTISFSSGSGFKNDNTTFTAKVKTHTLYVSGGSQAEGRAPATKLDEKQLAKVKEAPEGQIFKVDGKWYAVDTDNDYLESKNGEVYYKWKKARALVELDPNDEQKEKLEKLYAGTYYDLGKTSK